LFFDSPKAATKCSFNECKEAKAGTRGKGLKGNMNLEEFYVCGATAAIGHGQSPAAVGRSQQKPFIVRNFIDSD